MCVFVCVCVRVVRWSIECDEVVVAVVSLLFALSPSLVSLHPKSKCQYDGASSVEVSPILCAHLGHSALSMLRPVSI